MIRIKSILPWLVIWRVVQIMLFIAFTFIISGEPVFTYIPMTRVEHIFLALLLYIAIAKKEG